MIGAATRQDIQGAVDYAKNKIIERLLTKSDIQATITMANNRIWDYMQDSRQEALQYWRQDVIYNEQAWRRMNAMEMRLNTISQDLKTLKQLLGRMVDEQRRTTTTMSGMTTKILRQPIHSQGLEDRERIYEY